MMYEIDDFGWQFLHMFVIFIDWYWYFVNRKYKDYVYRKMLVQEYLKK